MIQYQKPAKTVIITFILLAIFDGGSIVAKSMGFSPSLSNIFYFFLINIFATIFLFWNVLKFLVFKRMFNQDSRQEAVLRRVARDTMGNFNSPSSSDPLNILKTRYANGEITKEEFDAKRVDIEK